MTTTFQQADDLGCPRLPGVELGPERFPGGDVDGRDLVLSRFMAYKLLGGDGELYESALPGTFGGHRRSRIYGRLDCPSALRAIARGGYVRHRVFFASAADARAAGYRACKICMK